MSRILSELVFFGFCVAISYLLHIFHYPFKQFNDILILCRTKRDAFSHHVLFYTSSKYHEIFPYYILIAILKTHDDSNSSQKGSLYFADMDVVPTRLLKGLVTKANVEKVSPAF